jgi:glycosyltransferase involved in cell wall biosynthesis
MKILFYCDEYPPAKHGGIGSVVKIIAETLAQKGHEIFVVGNYHHGHKLDFFSIINGVQIYRLTYFRYIKYIPNYLIRPVNLILRKIGYLSFESRKSLTQTEKFIEEIISTKNIDCVELVDYMGLLIHLKKEFIFNKISVPTIMRVHGSPSFLAFNRNQPQKILKNNDINNFNRCDKVSAVSKFSANYVINNLNIIDKEIKVIYNPIENSALSRKRVKGVENSLLFVGKITETKGAFSLLKAFNLLAPEFLDLTLTLVGGGNIDFGKKLLKPEIRDRVFFTGYISRTSIIDLIDKSTFCIVPSYFENFGMVALEIMARGKALIYTTRASGPEVISHLVDGLLVEPTDIKSIVSNIKLLLNNKELRDKLGAEAYKKIENNFLTDNIILELEEYYTSIIKKLPNTVK